MGRRKISKKVRLWYRLYRNRMKTIGRDPLPVRIWAALEIDKCEEGSLRERELTRFVGPAPQH